jgi:hypothetical protein
MMFKVALFAFAKQPAIWLALFALFGLTRCATLTTSECEKGDWRGIGLADGRKGEPATRINDHAEACAAAAVKPDMAAYEAGRTEGLATFCTPAGGFLSGARGSVYAGVCAGESEEAFLKPYRLASSLREKRERVKALESDLDDLVDSIKDERRSIREGACKRNPYAADCIGNFLSSGTLNMKESLYDSKRAELSEALTACQASLVDAYPTIKGLGLGQDAIEKFNSDKDFCFDR